MFYLMNIDEIGMLGLPGNLGKTHQLPFLHFWYLSVL